MAAFSEDSKNPGPCQYYFNLFRKKAIFRNKYPKPARLFPKTGISRNKCHETTGLFPKPANFRNKHRENKGLFPKSRVLGTNVLEGVLKSVQGAHYTATGALIAGQGS